VRHAFARLLFVGSILATALTFSAAADAAAQRTFVASYGLSGNTAFNCSIVNPCRAFSEAMSVTGIGGEVVVLDSAGYGPVVIDKSISIIAPAGIYAGITVTSGTGIDIVTPAADVKLKGLTINGQGGTTGLSMVMSPIANTSLMVEDCTISHMNTDGIHIYGAVTATLDRVRVERNNGDGIHVENGARFTVSNSSVFANQNDGIHVVVVGGSAGNSMRGLVERSTISDNGVAGIETGNLIGSYTIALDVRETQVVRNTYGLKVNVSSLVYASNSDINSNSGSGIVVIGTGAAVVASANIVSMNGYGYYVDTNGGIYTMGNNVVRDNTAKNINVGNSGGVYSLTVD